MLIELGMNYFTVGRLRFDPNSHLRFNLSPRAICADAMSKETQRGKEPLRVQQVHIERQKGAAKFTNGCRSEIYRELDIKLSVHYELLSCKMMFIYFYCFVLKPFVRWTKF